jgi:biopolymer transport protein ExbB
MNELLAQAEIQELSQTYFTQFFIAGGPIVWFVLLPMSIAGVYFWLDLTLSVRRGKLLPSSVSGDMITAVMRSGAACIPSRFGRNTDLISRAICAALGKTRKMHPAPSLLGQIAAESLQEQAMKLLRRAEWCNLLGNVSPMVGLFGTVWGMIDAFNILGIAAGQPRPGQLASAISVALITTFWGLLIAIPCLSIYGFFRSKIESLAMEAAVEVETLLERLSEIKPADSDSAAQTVAGARGGRPVVESPQGQEALKTDDILAAIQYMGKPKTPIEVKK